MAKIIIRSFVAVFLILLVLTSYIPMLSITAKSADNSVPVAGFGNALDFKERKRIDIPFNDSTKIGGNSDFTISMWACPEEGSSYQTLYRQYNVNAGTLGVWLRYINMYGGYLYCGFDLLGGIGGSGSGGWQLPWEWNGGRPPDYVKKVPLNQWFHVAMTKSGRNVTVYLNGEIYFEMELDDYRYNTPAPTSAKISVGSENEHNQYFDGRLDEVLFWNTALSQSQIKAWMFREIDSTHPKYNNLVYYYKLNQIGGTTITDSKGSNHGTPVSITGTDCVASDVRWWTVNAGSSVNGQLVGSDADGSSNNGLNWNLSFEIVSPPSKGNVLLTGENRFTYTADIDKRDNNTFTYKVKDAAGKYSNIHVQNINILPAVFTVRFETNGGSHVDDQSVVCGEKVTAPANPTKTGYVFAGWYKDQSLTNKWLFDTDTVTKDTVLYAKWDPVISVDVTWGNMEFTYTDGTWNPEKHKYESAGWSCAKNGNRIIVTSNSKVPVTVYYSYSKVAGYGSVSGSFTDGINPVNSHTLLAGDTVPQSCEAYVTLSGKPPECNKSKIGSVTVTVAD